MLRKQIEILMRRQKRPLVHNRDRLFFVLGDYKSTHHPTNKKPHSKKYRELKSPEYGDEITRRSYTPGPVAL